MKYTPLTITLLAIILMPLSAASDKVKFGEIGFAGNACLADTENAKRTSMNLGENSLRIIAEDFFLNSESSEHNLIRKKCDVALTVEVPDGYQIGIRNATSLAFLALDEDSKASIHLSLGFAGKRFIDEEVAFAALTNQNIELSNDEVQWAACGADTIVRLKASAKLRAKKGKRSYLRVNSFGLDFEYRECK